ncbi:MAG: type II toxin-antitoxin system Phd/YefM family antitoxin [Ardenticatenaceae bacterium]|nr:type II toxin-antitoxin system Phd/YefM family antitoxin [Ardenticatenaceae bacterium]MCB9446510.1 type II toxin-antitoxin system Phd/YefM family antitoxin [Ardenticatenaceae bacterium]
MSTKIMPVSDLRRQTSQVLKSVREGGDVVYITQHGRPAAVLVDYEQYESMMAQLEDAAEKPVSNKEAQLMAAAQLLLADYESDSELTAFTDLDGEEFHA